MERLAVIGLGNIATRHRRNLKLRFPAAKLFSMSSSGRIPTESIECCDELVSSIADIIKEKVQLVIVASPAPFHAKHAIPLIKAGIPTLIEKPVTTTVEEAQLIQQAINYYQTPVAIGYCLRYLPSALKLKELLAQRKIGTMYNAHIEIGQYLPDWRPNKDYRQCVSANKNLGGGALFELSHELDYTQWLLGPLTVQHAILRSSQELKLDVEDVADILTTNNENVVTTIHLDFLQRKAHRQCSFIGSEGRIDWDLIQNQLLFTTATNSSVVYQDPMWDKNQMYLAMIDDFIQMIEGLPHTCITIEEAQSTVMLIDDIRRQTERE
ncbi:Gfo/Idh/MocA family protein [Vibrio tapetis]|uniref:Oxidoreductase n=1 Tax=Vibrio tapetis subsp. tapetis TaxID=1671868 RepID=A0A2N8ZGJ2_9VIBR|nr:Gfo/Idh/MocA family oxidoreductase [Vibrio tapetis]SON50975.1 Oxidoreductase [Vibrio tapetis subsp. tapetis]